MTDPMGVFEVHGVRFCVGSATNDCDAVVAIGTSSSVVPEGTRFEFTLNHSEIEVPGGRVSIERGEPSRVRIDLDVAPTAEGLRHPYLSFPAAVIQHWRGRLVLHASSFDVGDRCVVLLGDKEAGKSTTVAAARSLGFPVRADDVVVIEGRDVLCGTSTIDLRKEAAEVFGGRALGRVGARERWRIDTKQASDRAPVGAFVLLSWGADLRLDRLPAARIVPTLYHAAAIGDALRQHVATAPTLLLDLIDVPLINVQRPRRLDQAEAVVRALARELA